MAPNKPKNPDKEPSFFRTIFQCGEELVSFLQKENNSYAIFILDRLNRDYRIFGDVESNKHHIQPKHAKGSDERWNLVSLSLEEHMQAHQLLFDCYNNHYDYCVVCLFFGKTKEAQKAVRKQNQINMKNNNRGFYNSALQRELARRPKPRLPYARKDVILVAIENGFIIEHVQTDKCLIVRPGKFPSLTAVLERLVRHPLMPLEEAKKWNALKKKQKSYLNSALTRTLMGHIDKRGKSVFTFKGWRVRGIFLSLAVGEDPLLGGGLSAEIL
jgi:hypothetical protein